ncbi:MAG: hypothetical protein GY882_01200 [Actinomycetia bacterium]|nr:hypothetical protein [Actinomycetes bacterium]
MPTPVQEAARYAAATVEEPLVETGATYLPVSALGMQARKKALRELRCIPAGIEVAAPVEAANEADTLAHGADPEPAPAPEPGDDETTE